jgi:hypothetical protein
MFGACLIAAACSGSDVTSPADPLLSAALSSLDSVYSLTAIDGHALPCCSHATSGGSTESWASSEVHFTGPDTYVWTVELRFDSLGGPRDFYTSIVDSVVSVGHYSRNGASLSFSDAATSRGFDAKLVSDTIAITYAGTTYSFRPVAPPGVSASQWSLLGSCVDAAGNAVGCPVTDDAGVVVTPVGGGLNFDYDVADGHYIWVTEYRYRYPDGTTITRQVTSSAGTYTWDGTTVRLTDSATGDTSAGRFDGSPGRLRIEAGSGVFEFRRLIQLPPG